MHSHRDNSLTYGTLCSTDLFYYPVFRVVILGIQRQSDIPNGLDGQTDMSITSLWARHTGHILWIFFKNTSNILKYAWIYLNVSLLDGRKGCSGIMDEQAVRVDRWTIEITCLCFEINNALRLQNICAKRKATNLDKGFIKEDGRIPNMTRRCGPKSQTTKFQNMVLRGWVHSKYAKSIGDRPYLARTLQ
jgi:hypothetical protein